MTRRTGGSPLRRKILLLGFSITISVFALELLLAAFAPRIRPYSKAFAGPPMPLTASSYLPAATPTSLVFRHRKAEFDVSYRFNALGYRGVQPRTLEKPSTTRRLLCVGDSFTLGWGNAREDTFVQRLADRLASQGWEVINGGYRGYLSPDAYYAYLHREGFSLKPDVVLVTLYSGNDVMEVRDNEWHEIDARGLPRRLTTIRLYTDHQGAFLFPPGTRERAVRWYYDVPVLRESRVFVGVAELGTRLAGASRPPRHEQFGLLSEPEPMDEGWRKFRLAVDGLVACCRERSVGIAFALVPPPPGHPHFQVEAGVHDEIARHVRSTGAHLIDLHSLLEAEHYYPQDGHLDPKGNEVVADGLLPFLLRTVCR